MIVKVFALLDTVGQAFRTLSMNESDELEKRGLAFAVNNDRQMLFMAKDLQLFEIAQMETKTGELIPTVPARFVVRAADLIGNEGAVDNEIR